MAITILTNPAALTTLRADLAYAQEAYVLAFKVQGEFFRDLFSGFADVRRIYLVGNHDNTPILRDLMREFPRLYAYTWSRNRLFHSKVVCLPSVSIAHVGSHNLTRYAYTIAINHTVRVDDVDAVAWMQSGILKLMQAAQALTPSDKQPAAGYAGSDAKK